MSARFVLAAIFLASCNPSSSRPAATPPALPSPQEPRGQIRSEVLNRTPPGTSAADVLRFISKLPARSGASAPKLESGPATGSAAEASGHAGAKHIQIVLGDYMPNPFLLVQPIPLSLAEHVTVAWAFDAQDRLLDVFVDKTAEFGE